MSKREEAMALFEKGYNCSQAVAGAFCDRTDIDFDTMMRLASVFGGGMGRLREICGTFSGINMVLGLAKGNGNKAELYKDVQSLAKQFTEDNGSIICRELLGLSIMGTPSHRRATSSITKNARAASFAATLRTCWRNTFLQTKQHKTRSSILIHVKKQTARENTFCLLYILDYLCVTFKRVLTFVFCCRLTYFGKRHIVELILSPFCIIEYVARN